MFPFALIDDAAQQIQKASDAIVAASDSVAYENVKFPISMDMPDRVLNHTVRGSSGLAIATDEYAFKQQTTDNDVSQECWDGQSLAQKFITSETSGNKVRKVTLTLNRIGSTTGDLTAHIYADNTGVPASSPLGSSTAVQISTINSKGNVTFTFGAEVTLAKNTPYWVVLTSTGNSSNKVVWYCKTSNPDPDYPASVKVGAGAWTNATDKNMTYILIGYYDTGSAEFPIKLAVGPQYQSAYFSATTDANSTVTIDIKNGDTDDTLYSNLTDGQAIALNPSNTPNIKIIVNMSRDAGQTITNPILAAVGFSGTAYQSKYQFVDREFRPTPYSKHSLDTGLERTSGGIKLLSTTSTLKSNSDSGYTDGSTYYANGSGQKVTQLMYTATAITITGFRMRGKSSAAYSVDGGIWLDSSGVPGTLQGSLKRVTVSTSYSWTEVIFDTPIDIPANTYFHAGFQYVNTVWYASNYTYAFEGLNVTHQAGVIVRNISYAIDLYGKCASASVTSELTLPGVRDHGMVYPLAYMPSGSSVTMTISDPITNSVFHTLASGEKCSLALLPTELFNRLKIVTTLAQTMDSPGPIAGICYSYSGTEMSPEPAKKGYKIATYTFGALGVAGNYLTINGKGKILAMSISGSTATSSYGDGHKLTIDSNVAYYRFYNVTSKTWAYLNTDFNFSTTLTAAPIVGFEFNERLIWDLTEYYGAQNGGSITVALEV